MSSASQVIKIATAEVGYLEKRTNNQLDNKTANAGYNNYTKYARDVAKTDLVVGNKQGYAWCAIFVIWCFYKAFGVEQTRKMLCLPKNCYAASVEFGIDYYKSNNRYSKTPQVGDQIFFNDGDGEPSHTGLVYAVDSNYVYTIEGNTSSKSGVVANGGAVEKKAYKRNYNRINGYGHPIYADVAKQANVVTKKTDATYDNTPDNIKEVQNWLNKEYKANLTIDGVYNAKTKAAIVKVLQGTLKVVVDGEFGAKSKSAFVTLKKGSIGLAVKCLQCALICNGHTIGTAGADGDFGEATEKAVKAFQKKKKLDVDGIVGKNTAYSLFG